MRRGRILSRLFLGLNLVFVSFLAGSYLAPFISPEWTTLPSFLGLAYPYLLLINLLFALFWALMFRKYFLLSLVVTSAGYFMFIRHFQVNLRQELSGQDIVLKVMSYNVRMFDSFDWKKDESSLSSIINVIDNESPDVLCLQEFYNRVHGPGDIVDRILSDVELPHSHTEYELIRRGHAYGIATFSRYPILEKGRIDISTQPVSFAIYTDILRGPGDTLRIYNLHLASYRFGAEDYHFMEQLKKDYRAREWKASGLKMLTKLHRGFIARARQAEDLQAHIASSPFPVIVCGDFNDTPASYAYHRLSQGLKDAFIEAGSGSGTTYAGIFPAHRIDYILHSGQYKAINYRSLNASGSDHKPVVCYLIHAPETPSE